MQTASRDIALFPVEKIDYPYATSTVFSAPSLTEDAADEKIGDLLVVDYRYARFALDPRTGLFSMIRLVSLRLPGAERSIICHSGWRDSTWSSLAAIQNGLTPSVRAQRSILFGQNSLDIQGKSAVSLLIDEVRDLCCICSGVLMERVGPDHSPFLHLSNCEHSSVVIRRLLLLCVLYRFDFSHQHCNHFDRYEEGRFPVCLRRTVIEACFLDDCTDEGDVAIHLSS